MATSDELERCKNCRCTIRPGYRHDRERRGLCREMNDSPALAGNWLDPNKPHFENEVK